jgi:hypothetical protein
MGRYFIHPLEKNSPSIDRAEAKIIVVIGYLRNKLVFQAANARIEKTTSHFRDQSGPRKYPSGIRRNSRTRVRKVNVSGPIPNQNSPCCLYGDTA